MRTEALEAAVSGVTNLSPAQIVGEKRESSSTVWTEYSLLAFLVCLFVVQGFVPAWRSSNTDFRNYYVAARLYREGSSLLRVYDFTWFQRQKDHLGVGPGLVGFVPDTLLSALPIAPLAELPVLTAKRIWLAINAILLGLVSFLLSQLTRLGARRVFIVVFMAIEPLATNFLYGQMHLLVLFLMVLAAWLVSRQQPFTAGVSVALAAGLKLYPGLYLLFFLCKRQWRALAGTAVGLLSLAGFSIYIFGWNVHRIYVGEILPQMGRGENIDPYASRWNSLTALLHRALIAEPGQNPHPLLHAPNLYAVLQPLCQGMIFVPAVWVLVPGWVRREHAQLEWAAYTAMLMALSTGPTAYHHCILILAAALGFDALWTTGRRREAYTVIVLYSLICLPWLKLTLKDAAGWHILLASPRVYPLLALPILLYGCIGRIPAVRERLQTRRRETCAFGFAFLMLVAAGVFQSLQHERGLFDNYSSRLFTLRESLLMGNPAIGANGLFFVRMPGNTPSFEMSRWIRNGFHAELVAEDEFHPTASPLAMGAWVEVSGPVSSIIRLIKPVSSDTLKFQAEVINGEQPSISLDAKLLAFVRENHGRGELWIKDVGRGTNLQSGAERMLVEHSSDVWEVAIEPGNQRIVYTAAPKGRPILYTLDLASGRTAILSARVARYPAYSPDGRWLAYSHLENGTWHLCVMDLTSRLSRRLIGGDCNSISPVWESDGKSLIYATDCGRGLEMTALVRTEFSPNSGDLVVGKALQ